MNGITFLNPLVLGGLALASIPIIIHLLFRRRFRRVDWAPMRYLKLSLERNRRRLRIEQWLLLLLRTLAIIVLALLFARPVLHAHGLGGWLGGTSRTSRILLVDDSLSMGYRDRGRSALERARDVALESLQTAGPRDRLTIVLASQPAAPLLRDVELTKDNAAVEALQGIQPTETAAHWPSVLAAVDELVRGTTYPIRELTLLTDLRRSGWDSLGEVARRWQGQDVRVRVLDVGSTSTANVALENLRRVDRLAVIGSPVRCEALVKNAGPSDLDGVDATLSVDGKPTLVRLPPLPVGRSVSVALAPVFQEPGGHTIAFELPTDALPGDNHAWLATNVRDHADILLIDGEPASEPLGGELDFFALALSLGGDETAAFRIEQLVDSQWSPQAAGSPDLIVLGNVAVPSAEQAAWLERQVAGGAGLMIFLGEQVDVDTYNRLLENGGRGVLPAALVGVEDQPFSGLDVEADPRSPLVALGQLKPTVLERIKLARFYQVEPNTADKSVRVLARWNNAAGSPAAIEKTLGRGRVLLWTLTADRAWSDWPTEPSYVLAMRESAKAIIRLVEPAPQVIAGETLRVPLEQAAGVRSMTVDVPDGPNPLPATLHDVADGQPAMIVWNDTRRAGIYQFAWRDSAGAKTLHAVANPAPAESGLLRIEPDGLRGFWAPLEPDVISAQAISEGDTPLAGREIWRNLAIGLLALVVVESGLAAWTSRQH